VDVTSGQIAERREHVRHDLVELPAPFLAWCGRTQCLDRGIEGRDPPLQVRLHDRQASRLRFLDDALHLATAERDTEKLYCQVRHLVSFVEDDGLGSGQEFDEATFLHRQVGQQQVVIDDDEIRLLRCTPRTDDMAFVVLRAFLAEAVFAPSPREPW
jgi:hypothetical protein